MNRGFLRPNASATCKATVLRGEVRDGTPVAVASPLGPDVVVGSTRSAKHGAPPRGRRHAVPTGGQFFFSQASTSLAMTPTAFTASFNLSCETPNFSLQWASS